MASSAELVRTLGLVTHRRKQPCALSPTSSTANGRGRSRRYCRQADYRTPPGRTSKPRTPPVARRVARVTLLSGHLLDGLRNPFQYRLRASIASRVPQCMSEGSPFQTCDFNSHHQTTWAPTQVPRKRGSDTPGFPADALAANVAPAIPGIYVTYVGRVRLTVQQLPAFGYARER